MRASIGDRGEMKRSKRYLDEQIERLLAGDPNSDIGEGVTDLVNRLQTETVEEKPASELAATLAAVASEAESAPARARARTGKPLPMKWRRRIVLSTFLSSLLGKLLVGSVALAATTGGLAATGELPDPLQEWSADQLGVVGIEIPGPDEQADQIAKDVVGEIRNGHPRTGDEFGTDVADTASDEKSTDGLDTADAKDDNADVADDQADVADDHTDQTDGKDVADDHTDEADDANVELPDEADTRRP